MTGSHVRILESPVCCAQEFRPYPEVSGRTNGHLKCVSDGVTWLDLMGP